LAYSVGTRIVIDQGRVLRYICKVYIRYCV